MELREELLHPLFSHLPIAMFFIALVAKSIELGAKSYSKSHSEGAAFIARVMIFTSPMLYMINIFLGDIALEAVKNNLCNIGTAYQHESLAEEAMIWFLIPIAMEALTLSRLPQLKKFLVLISFVSFFGLLVSNYKMLQAAHLGAELVYEQGAGVSRELGDCKP